MMRAAIISLSMLYLVPGAYANQLISPNAIGDWARQDGQTRIRIAPCGAAICATNIWVRDPAGDEKLGDTLIMTLSADSPTTLSGHAYDARRRMTYSMRLSFEPPGMQTRGCVLLGILCKTAQWTRIP